MITKKQLKNEIFDIRKMLDETRMSIKQLRDYMAAEFVQRDKAIDVQWQKLQEFQRLGGVTTDRVQAELREFEQAQNVKIGKTKDCLLDIIDSRSAMFHKNLQKEVSDLRKAIKSIGGTYIVNPKLEPMPECTLFDGMNKAVADFDKACEKAGFKCTEQKKRQKGDILREATERNLISIDGLRMRYGWSKPAIIKAINFYKWPLEKIEGSKLDYVNKSHIFILKEYFTPKCMG